MYELNKILPIEMICTVYNVTYKLVFQYGLITWGSCAGNEIRLPLKIQQNQVVSIWLNKKNLNGSTAASKYKDLKVDYQSGYCTNNSPYYVRKIKGLNMQKSVKIAYDIKVDYAIKNVGKHFPDYLSPSNFNKMPMQLKKYIYLQIMLIKRLKINNK